MKVLGLVLLTRPTSPAQVPETSVTIVKEAYDLSSIPFFERSNARELIKYGLHFFRTVLIYQFCYVFPAVRVLVGKVGPGGMRSLNYPEVNHIFHIVVKSDGRAACTISSQDYPTQSGISSSLGLLKQDPASLQMDKELKKIQDPAEADKFLVSIIYVSILYLLFFV